jgi:hypothetical protein
MTGALWRDGSITGQEAANAARLEKLGDSAAAKVTVAWIIPKRSAPI